MILIQFCLAIIRSLVWMGQSAKANGYYLMFRVTKAEHGYKLLIHLQP